MKFSEQWLREWVNPALSTQELVDQVTMAGLEVDAVEAVAAEFSGVVVGQVVSREQHPDADKLSLCQVTDGAETFQIVCGAANVREGLKIPFAKIGAVLPTDDGKGFKIKKAKLRGVESFGMLCADSELGMAESSDGLLELAADAPVGTDFREYLGLDDQCIEVDLTPNRGDCLSIAGLARDVGVLNKAPVTPPAINAIAPVNDDKMQVELSAPADCPRYVSRVINNIDLSKPTPVWMQEKLRRSGIRSIDAVVDVTNYVLLELGQPLHAFDKAILSGAIKVRRAIEGETLVLLDDQEIKLKPDTLLITDSNGPLAMAGIMGGKTSGVTSETTSIVLESAYFNPISIAGRARNYGLHTDSSHRFERGVDYKLQVNAIERATALLLEIVGGEPGPVVEQVSAENLPADRTVVLKQAKLEQVLGLELSKAEVTDILTRLGLLVTDIAEGWQAEVPSYRFDISFDADLIEEVGRIYGYNRLPVRTPKATVALQADPEVTLSLSSIRRHFVAKGYQEAITYSFVEPKFQKHFTPDIGALALANPISADMAVMRTSLWPGLVKAMQHNLNRQQSRVRLFETGLRFVPEGKELKDLQQTPMLSGLITGARDNKGWTASSETVDFFDIKGDVEALLDLGAGSENFIWSAGQHPALHPGQCAELSINGKSVGFVGAVHPSVAAELGTKQNFYLFELDLAMVQEGILPSFTELSKFPEVSRDLAVVVDKDLQVTQVTDAIREVAGEFLTDVSLFDVYQGKGIDPERKSLAMGLTWQAPSRTLNDEEITKSMDEVITLLAKRFDAQLRS